MNTPDDRKYNRTHEWAQYDGELVTVGISDFAQDQLGDVVFVELPEVGRRVESQEAVAVVESVKTASDIYAPVSGEIAEVNEALESRPELINDDPYGEGWLFRLRTTEEETLEGMLDASGYEASVEEES